MWGSMARSDGTKWRRLIVAAAAVLVLLIVVVTYSLFATRHQAAVDTSDVPPTPVAPPARAAADGEVERLLRTSDPERFAEQVAEVLFTWDTRALATSSVVVEQLAALADPTGESSAGLVADIANYLPTDPVWIELRTYETRQWLEVTSTEVPDLWATAEAQAGDQLLPGTAAFTIRGVRHRAGVWEGEDVASQHDVAFTVFVVCAPAYPECHLLRLSRLDEPLD